MNPRGKLYRAARRSGLTVLIAPAVASLVIAEAILLFTGRRILVAETKVEPGQTYVVDGYGDLGTAGHSSLVCRYFTGRSTVTTVWWHSPNNIRGRDSCPFIHTPS
jgi:hypothetical protein